MSIAINQMVIRISCNHWSQKKSSTIRPSQQAARPHIGQRVGRYGFVAISKQERRARRSGDLLAREPEAAGLPALTRPKRETTKLARPFRDLAEQRVDTVGAVINVTVPFEPGQLRV